MASATSFSNVETSQTPLLPQATKWADILRKELLLVAPYDDSPDGTLPMDVTVDEAVLGAPRRRAADSETAALAEQIADLLYPSPDHSLGPIIKYEKDVVKLRRYVLQQRKRDIEVATARNNAMTWEKRVLSQGPWNPVEDPVSLAGAPSLPMPVQIADHDTLEPFFEHLRLGGTEEITSSARAIDDAIEADEPYYGTKTLEFEKGVVYSDRRMDLCKMVLGPPNIGDLLESLRTNTFITHFLLGNNIIGPHGARCIVDFLKEFPDRMDTWYLAGNCIDGPSFKSLVDEWVKSSSVTNIWLKRNPLGPDAADDVFRLVTQTPNLHTLDLDQTELGDVGVAELFSKLAKYESEKTLPLQHIYLNAVGIGAEACTAIAEYLATPNCPLDSLYMTNNPMGSDGLRALSVGLKQNKSLTRLTVASVGAADDGITALCEALSEHPCIVTLDIGQSFSTPDLNQRYNWISDRSTYALHNLVTHSPSLQYLNLSYCALTHSGLNEILRAILTSSTMLYYSARTIHPQSKGPLPVSESQKHIQLSTQMQNQLAANVKRKYGKDVDYNSFLVDEKRWLVNDKTDVRKIDSVYRNRDAGLARRGLKKLDKWWDDDDETLKEVMKGAVGPVCTKKLNIVGPVCTRRKGVVA
ncbi:RNI-like protein [Amniculicola lignicola CBS 123094]|uniref:RNI-like protein n=1 Tax=Amniculicola lignicola CBS 123094 TaxID=1392246 RepID=A0A6A5VWC1_9PLEO|nr:RNI-like protein [Amniculicola lignicola CBS 123094]